MTTLAKEIEETLIDMRDDRQREIALRFFKTVHGQYGEGDQFLGIKNPNVRIVVKEAWKSTSIEEVTKLVKSQWHEVRLCGLLILVKKMEKAVKLKDDAQMRRIFQLYLSLHSYVNNWDLVDLSSITIAGEWEKAHPEEEILDEWITDERSTLWQRRIAMVSTWRLVRVEQYDKLKRRAEVLIQSKEELLHKAAGWMLREMGKNGGMYELRDFLTTHAPLMPSVMLRYAIEKMPEDERQAWLKRRRLDAKP